MNDASANRADHERAMLLRTLESQRRHVLGTLEGLSDEQLRAPVLPSGWSCIGMIKHLALADEHYWFRSIVGGGTVGLLSRRAECRRQVAPDESAGDVIELYRNEIESANAVITETPIDMAPRRRDPLWDEWGMDVPDLRFVMLHMVTETACHAGHLEAARELIDGRQWIVV